MDADTDFDHLMHKMRAFTELASTIHGIMLWDLVICFPSEVKHIFWPDLLNLLRQGILPSLTSCLLLLSRLLVVPMVSLGKTLVEGQPSSCAAVYRALLVLHATSIAVATAVFVVRTLTIRSSRWPLTVFLWSLWAAQSTAWYFWATVPTVGQVPRVNSYTGTCQHLSNNMPWTWVMFLAYGLFDLFILLLTLELYIRHFGNLPICLRTWRQKKKEVSEQFFQDTILYFALSLAVATLEIAWVLSHFRQEFYTALMGPVQVWLTLVISPRVIRNIKLHNARTARMTSLGTLAISSKSANVDCKREQDVIHFDTSILERVGAADHFYPPAHLRPDAKILKATQRDTIPGRQSDCEKQDLSTE